MLERVHVFIGTLFALPYLALCLFTFKGHYKVSKKVFGIYMAVFTGLMLLTGFMQLTGEQYLGVATQVYSLVTMLVGITILILVIDTSLPKLLYVFFIVASYATGVSNVATNFESRAFPEYYRLYSYYTHNMFHAAFLLISIPFMWRFLKKQVKPAITGTDIPAWKTMWIIPAMFVLVISIFTGTYEIERVSSMEFLVIVLLLTLGSFLIYNVAIRMVVQTDKSAKLQSIALREQEANHLKSNFLAAMSHEIRTPMNAIIGIAQIELQKGNLPDESMVALEKIHNSGNNLLGIINDILDMSKIEAGKMELNPIEYDIPSLINDTVQLNIVRIGSKPIRFVLDIDEALPLKMYGDELRLKQILNNLLSNAIKYTENGHVKLSASHSHAGDDIVLRFVVEDSGQGMTPEDLNKLFSEYTRFNAESNRTTEGTGIGLSITKSLIKLMEGDISAQSEYGKGSVFTVAVKQKAVECEAIGAELSKQLRNFSFTGSRQHSRLQITKDYMPYGSVLIVDDVETNLYVSEGLLAPYGLAIDTAISGYIAIDKIQSGGLYDVIFMDHMMPGMDGIETTKKLRETGYKGVIVALTANALAGNDTMFMQNGFDDFISKPIDIRQLNACLNKYIRDRHPDEAAGYKSFYPDGNRPRTPETALKQSAGGFDPKLLRVFRRDAEKAVAVLRDTAASGDMKLFSTTAHAMKSALANIGEPDASQQAAALERAGLERDLDYISANVESFTALLERLISTITPQESENKASEEPDEDAEYLVEQLRAVSLSCEAYDRKAAYSALDLLKEKAWKNKTRSALERIEEMLRLHSDFEGAAELAVKLTEGLPYAKDSDAEESDDFIIKMRTLKWLSPDRASEMLGGYEAYEQTVRLSIKHMPANIGKLETHIGGDIDLYAIEIHGVKGILYNIGAYELGDAAEELERLSKAGDAGSCVAGHAPFVSGLNAFLNAIIPLLETGEALKGSNEQLMKLISEIEAAVTAYDGLRAIELIAPLSGSTYGQPVDSLLVKLTRAVEAFDFDRAAEAVQDIKNALALV